MVHQCVIRDSIMYIPANWLADISLIYESIVVELVASLAVVHKLMIINDT